MKLVDSHCHLDGEEFAGDLDQVIARARATGVEAMMAIGTGDGPADLESAIRLAEAYPSIWATIGVHPHDAAKAVADTWQNLAALTARPKVVAVGEIGLDYHYDFSPRAVQRDVFARQLEIAREAAKPIVIHTREAWEETFELIETHWPREGPGGIMHCFSGGPAEAQRSLELGFHISFSGIVTYPKATDVRKAAELVPQDRLLIETDCPYLAPVPVRGKRNEPAFVAHTAVCLAGIRGVTRELIAEATTRNWERLCLRRTVANE